MGDFAGFIGKGFSEDNELKTRISTDLMLHPKLKISTWSDNDFFITHITNLKENTETQPIFNENKNICLILYGEVFDYQEERDRLLAKGYCFQHTNNDAEFCLHLYEDKGKDAFISLNGSFCLCIYHLDSQKLVLVRDRFFSRRIYFYLSPEKELIFSTRVSSIVQAEQVPRDLNIDSIFEFFCLNKTIGTKTYYKSIQAVPAAACLSYSQGEVLTWEYWQRKFNVGKKTKKYYKIKLAATLKNAVNIRMREDFRYGLFLSGGMDSRMILAAADRELVCLTAADLENQETRISRSAANAVKAPFKVLQRSFDHYIKLIDEAINMSCGMNSFMHAHFLGFFDAIKQDCDVILHGWYIERLFRGTMLLHKHMKLGSRKIALPFLQRLNQDNIGQTVINNPELSMYSNHLKYIFTPQYSQKFDSALITSIAHEAKKAAAIADDFKDTVHYLTTVFDYYHTDLFPLHMRYYMPERTIAFDNELFDLYFKMPYKYRANSRLWNKVLRQFSREIAAIPYANTGYSPFLPETLIWFLTMLKKICKKVLPFKSNKFAGTIYTDTSWPNFAELIRLSEKLQGRLKQTINDPESLDPELFNIPELKRMLIEHLDKKSDHAVLLFMLLSFGHWHKKYGPQKNQPLRRAVKSS